MEKHRTLAVDQSNIANYGGADHQKQIDEKANAEQEWVGAGVEPGIQIWRIENFGVKKWPQEKYGTFYSGDSFIVLHTYKKNATSETLMYELYFWLGSSTTQDESGTAAYKAVELDDYLKGRPNQHREVQGSESTNFLKLFGNQILLLDGGVDSAFNSVKPIEYKPRLLHLKGKRHVRVTQVPLSVSSLNQGDVFLLDTGLFIIQWNGTHSGAFERRKGAEIISGLKNERMGRPKSEIIEGNEDSELFWSTLGGKSEVAAPIPDDEVAIPEKKTLLHLSDASGEMVCNEVGSTTTLLSRALLNSDDVFILDLEHCVIVWVGKGANASEKKSAFTYATNYLTSKGKPLDTPVSRIVEGGETDLFNSAFSN